MEQDLIPQAGLVAAMSGFWNILHKQIHSKKVLKYYIGKFSIIPSRVKGL